MATRGLLFRWASAIKIQLNVVRLVDIIIISSKCNLVSPWYTCSWKTVHSDLNNKHSLTNMTMCTSCWRRDNCFVYCTFWIFIHDITNTKDTWFIQKGWRWLGHVLRKPSEDMTKIALRWTPEGKRKIGRQHGGAPWKHGGTIERKVNNREEWRKLRHSKD